MLAHTENTEIHLSQKRLSIGVYVLVVNFLNLFGKYFFFEVHISLVLMDIVVNMSIIIYYIIQLMHFFRLTSGFVNLRGLTNPDVNQKRMHQLFCYMTLSLFS